MPVRCLKVLAVMAGLFLSSCTSIPDSYAPPVQRKPLNEPELAAFGHFVDMGDPNAEQYLVRDISHTAEGGGFRWVYQHPELRFSLSKTDNLKYMMDFAIPAVTMKQTGPVTISFFINGNLLDKVRYDTPGEQHFEKPVPSSWLRTDTTVLASVEIDKMYVAPGDGRKLGFVVTRAGFIE